jgi:peroxiredoxin
LPFLEKLKNRFADQPFRVVMIDVGEPADTVRRFISHYNYTFPVLLDTRGKVSAQYNVLGHPVKFLVDKKGNLVFTAMGYRDWDAADWVASLEKYLKVPGRSGGR